MEITYSLQSTINIVLLILGVSFGILLIALHQKEQRNTFFLGVFMILFGLSTINEIVIELNLIKYYPKLEYLPFDFLWLLFPVFYLYVQDISIVPEKKKYNVLIPGIVAFLFFTGLLLFDLSLIVQVFESPIFGLIYYLGGIVYSIVIMVRTFKLITVHTKKIKNQYSTTEYKGIIWIKYFSLTILLYFMSSFVALILVVIFQESAISLLDTAFLIINMCLIFWASFKGIMQHEVKLLIPEETNTNTSELCTEKDVRKELPQENNTETKEIIDKLRAAVEEFELFKHVDLTIIDVAEKIGVHPRKLSATINSNLGSNFNQFINNYRVEYAKKLLKNNLGNNFTIEAIAHESGFKSRTSFYTAFKNSTQMTPIKYKESRFT
ncbi:helix-turn-helix transcriptional regulator [Tenacibaculum aiptasiae]|uniref:Helix-turn-helix transcriptional regulator n=1 Tax=Tenacibaculum aiptasiae TaxID=426481 RepID=A0A7J5A8S6_9FLAO|nr:helix-turn-helix transcriptional regulator [Tenacibaculum aiptasiae]KAB1153927.1 helix-turn-helix transcriptional regulator [Tenacibaculum aiptasiae]